MEVVAIAEPGDLSAPALGALAADLGTTLYELRLLLNAGYPAVVVSTTDPERARATRDALARHRHRVVSCSEAEMTPSARMSPLRDFALEPDAVLTSASGPVTERLRYDSIGALVRATHRLEATRVEQIEQRKLRPGAAVLSGGLILTKTVKRDVTTTAVSHESVLYLFPRTVESPLILREHTAHYQGLGAALHPTSHENFATTVARLRALAPHAAYDERLKTARPVRGLATGAAAADWLAHLIARDALRPRSGPGR